MLHRLELSPRIVAALTEAVRVQFRLLEYAAQTASFDEARCRDFVDLDASLAGRGAVVAKWVADARVSRRKPLDDFAAHPDADAKQEWSEALRAEAFALLNGIPAALTAIPEAAPPWQEAGSEFLRAFYEVFSGSGLPAGILGPEREGFGRQEFLRAFQEANPDLYVCASCDEARVGTRHARGIHAQIDHFFPKSRYPHLSIHPYNLVPVCHSCNSGIKGDRDPLQSAAGLRLGPADVALPYHREAGLASDVLLAVDLDAWRRSGSPFRIQPRGEGARQSQIDGLEHVWQIPSRWNQNGTMDEIGETVFRRLEQFLRAHPGLLERPIDEERLGRKLNEFLGVMWDVNLGRDPYSFAMKWLLAALAEAPDQGGRMSEALREELRDWAGAPRLDETHESLGAELRELVRTARGQ